MLVTSGRVSSPELSESSLATEIPNKTATPCGIEEDDSRA